MTKRQMKKRGRFGPDPKWWPNIERRQARTERRSERRKAGRGVGLSVLRELSKHNVPSLPAERCFFPMYPVESA